MQQLQQQAQTEQAKLQQQYQMNSEDNETKILVANIQAEHNSDGVQEPEYSEENKASLMERIREFDAKLRLDRDRLNFDKQKHKEDNALKRELKKITA